MSTCISTAGEFSQHELTGIDSYRFTCQRCGVLDEDAMVAALDAAEAVCLMFGWSGVNLDTDRGLATSELWHRWANTVPDGFTSPRTHPELVASEEVLAESRRRTRRATVARIREARS